VPAQDHLIHPLGYGVIVVVIVQLGVVFAWSCVEKFRKMAVDRMPYRCDE